MDLSFDWATMFVMIFIASIFVADEGKRIWQGSNNWTRRYKKEL